MRVKKIIFISLPPFFLVGMHDVSTPKNRGCMNQIKNALFVFFESAGQESLHRYGHIHPHKLMAIQDEKHNSTIELKNNLKKRN